MDSMVRRLVTTSALALALAGCAHAPRSAAPLALAQPDHFEVSGAPADLGAKFKVPNRETGRRAKAAMNAEFLLRMEADEDGPPNAAKIFRAHEQRKALERTPTLAPQEKAAGLQPSQWQALGPSNIGGPARALAFAPPTPPRMPAGPPPGRASVPP